jgi:hypothetical protein
LGTLKRLVDVLLTQHAHDFHDVVNNTVVNTVHATDTAPVARANIVDGLIQAGLPSELIEALKERSEVSVRLSFTVIANPTSVDSLEIGFRDFADPITRHCAAFLP